MRRTSTFTTVSNGSASCQKIQPFRSSMMWTRGRRGERWSFLMLIWCAGQRFLNQNKSMTSNPFWFFPSCQFSSSHSGAPGGSGRRATGATFSAAWCSAAPSSTSTGISSTCVRKISRLARKLQSTKCTSQLLSSSCWHFFNVKLFLL